MEKQNRILARDVNHGNIFLCKHGNVHCNWINVGIKFSTEDFINFAPLVNDAYHRLKDLNGKDNRESEFEKLDP
ncbi:hypothetical protein KAW96_06320 [candidate division WOR-3 bacterium]|nr:hypothetical protein [candidate division WOR-3 bacterium]